MVTSLPSSTCQRYPLRSESTSSPNLSRLPQGTHNYKFVVDGQEVVDDNSAVDDDKQNNVINIKKGDFEVFEALAMDLASNTNPNNNNNSSSGSPPGTQSMAQWMSWPDLCTCAPIQARTRRKYRRRCDRTSWPITMFNTLRCQAPDRQYFRPTCCKWFSTIRTSTSVNRLFYRNRITLC